jgi:dipeptidyl aminopeptidase/acylaminoacyl peptidase
MIPAVWRRRFLAPCARFPIWARDRPDRLVYSSNRDGKWETYALDLGTEMRWQVTDRPLGTAHGRIDALGERIWWFDDDNGSERGRWVVDTFHADGVPAVLEQVSAGYPTGIALGAGVAVLSMESDGGFELFSCAAGTAPRRLHRGDATLSVSGISTDDRLFCIEHAEHGDPRNPALRVCDVTGGVVAELWDGAGQGLWCGDWSPVAGDPRLIVYHERRGAVRPAIWDVSRGAVQDLAIEGEGEVEAAWYPDAGALLLNEEARGRSRLLRFAVGADDALPAGVPIASPRGTVRVARVRPNGAVWLEWESGSCPSEVRDADGPAVLGSGEERAPTGRDYRDIGVEGIHGFLVEPAAGGSHPAVFMVHGGPHLNWSDSFSPMVQAWADHGFTVVLVNYRGSSGYGKAWRDAIHGNPGFTELEDLARVRARLCDRGIVDPRRIVMWGGSWGGYLCLLAMGLQPELWSLGVAHSPIADYAAAYRAETDELRSFDRALFGGSPDELPEKYRERSPIAYVDRVRAPVMIVAGERDARCPIEQVEAYVSALVARGKTCDLIRTDAGHLAYTQRRLMEDVSMEIAFAARHLGTTAPL